MLKKFCLLIAFVMILTVSCVSASEDANIDDLSLETPVDTMDVPTESIDNANQDIIDSSDASDVVEADKKNPNLNISYNIDQTGDFSANITAEKNATGNIKYNLTNSSNQIVLNDTTPLDNGSVIIGGLGLYLPQGKYVLTAYYEGDGTYSNATASIEFNVDKKTPTFSAVANVNQFGMIIINATIDNDATGNVTFRIVREGEEPKPERDVTVEIINGSADFDELTPFKKGNYLIYTTYSGDANYYAAYINYLEANVTKDVPNLDLEIYSYNKNIILTITTNNTQTGIVNVTLYGDKNYTWQKNLTNGRLLIQDTVDVGEYEIWVTYLENENFYEKFLIDSVYSKIEPDMDVNATVNDYGEIIIEAELNSDATGNVTFTIMNSDTGEEINITVAVENGTASYNELTPFKKGEYSISAKYSGDTKYEDREDVDFVNVTKETLSISHNATVTGNEVEIIIAFPKDATGNITVYYLSYGSNQTYAIKNGTVIIDEIFDNGNQSVLITYEGNDKYYGFYNYYVDFYVKASSLLTVKDVSVVYNNDGKVQVTLTDNNNKKGSNPIANALVEITINGKTYTGYTDKNGKATITINTNLAPKTYASVAKYGGNATCNGDTTDFKYIVKKATPTLTAGKKTFKVKTKTKKYTVTLKTNKGKALAKAKVSLKVKGKTFKATTNAKGKATFKITNLKKKGKFTAKVTYNGNSYYNKVTKSAKITVK